MQQQVIEGHIDRDKFTYALTAVAAALVDTELGWVQLHFSGEAGTVLVSAVSHTLSIKQEFKADYSGSGVLKVSGRQLTDYIKHLPAGKIYFKADIPQKITFKCGRSSARIQLLQDDSANEVQVPEVGVCLKGKGLFLERWVNSFKDFVLVDDPRGYANGALVWIEKTGDVPVLCAVASEGYRLASCQLSEGIAVVQFSQDAVLIPKKSLEELRRVVAAEPDKEHTLRWHKESGFFAVQNESYVLMSMLISHEYPPYSAAIPKTINTQVIIEKSVFLESVKRVMLFADKNKNLILNFDGAMLQVQTSTPGLKEGEEFLELSNPVSSSFRVTYSGHLLQGVLNALNGNRVFLNWETLERPVQIQGEDERGLKSFYLLVATRF